MAETHDGFQATRRHLLRMGLASLAWSAPGLAFAASPQNYERTLSFRHLHTDETLKTVYWIKGHYIPEALSEINHFLRDFRTGEATRIDRHLMDLLYAMRRRLGTAEPIHIVSGYRSPATNDRLRRRSKGVARNSLHMQGKAVDLRVPGHGARTLATLGRELKAGGVGYYPRSNFVHLDVGNPRYWRG